MKMHVLSTVHGVHRRNSQVCFVIIFGPPPSSWNYGREFYITQNESCHGHHHTRNVGKKWEELRSP
jgi:hypothetical protein